MTTSDAQLVRYMSFIARVFMTSSFTTDKSFGRVNSIELGILNDIIIHQIDNNHTWVSRIANDLSLPKQTVSRCTIKFIENGTLRDFPHPTDARSRFLEFTDTAWDRSRKWADTVNTKLSEDSGCCTGKPQTLKNILPDG